MTLYRSCAKSDKLQVGQRSSRHANARDLREDLGLNHLLAHQ
jgi:hypothetical protein